MSGISLTLKLDTAPLLAAIREAEALASSLPADALLPEIPGDLVTVESDLGTASAAGELIVRLDPGNGLLGLVAALRARQVDAGLGDGTRNGCP